MAAPVTTHRFTVDEYHRMAEAGIFHEGDRVELIDGQVLYRDGYRTVTELKPGAELVLATLPAARVKADEVML